MTYWSSPPRAMPPGFRPDGRYLLQPGPASLAPVGNYNPGPGWDSRRTLERLANSVSNLNYDGRYLYLDRSRGYVGGGNAGQSVQPGMRTTPVVGNVGQSVQPGMRTTPVVGNFSGGSRAAVAIQNAAQGAKVGGLGVAAPAMGWDQNPSMRDSAMAAGQAAAAARGDAIGSNGMISQRGGGYLGQDQLPGASDPSNDAYWARADMSAWANANKGLASKMGWVEGKNYNASGQLPDPAQSYQTQLQMPEGFNPQSAGFQPDPSAPAAPPIGANFGQAAVSIDGMGNPSQVAFNPGVTQAVAPPAQDPAARVAPNQMPTTGDSAGALNRSYLEAIKQASAAPAFEPEVGDDRFNPWGNPALLNNLNRSY